MTGRSLSSLAWAGLVLVAAFALIPQALKSSPVAIAQALLETPSQEQISAFATNFSPEFPECAVRAFADANRRLPQGYAEMMNWSTDRHFYDPATHSFTCASGAPPVAAGVSDAQIATFASSFSPAPPTCAVKRYVDAHQRLPNGWVDFTTWSAENGTMDPATQTFKC